MIERVFGYTARMPTTGSTTVLGRTLIDGRVRLDSGEAEWLLQLAEFHRNGDCAVDGCRDTKHWLRYFCRMSGPTAKEKLRVALTLQQQPDMYDALADGRVSYCQIRAISRYRGANIEVIAALLAAAEAGNSVADLERAVRYAHLLAEQDRDPDSEPADWEHLGLRVRSQYDGFDTIELTIRKDDTARILAIVDAKLDHDFHAPSERDSHDTHEVVDSRESTAPDPTTMAERRLHALLDILEAGVAKLAESGDIDIIKATMNVLVDYDRLYRDAHHGACETDRGQPLTGDAARRLACNANYVRIITKGRSLTLDVGNATRQWNAAQRRAIRAKYAFQCSVPVCHNRILDIHHVYPVEHGGETNVAFGLPFCRCHHHLVHEGGWWVTLDPSTYLATLHSPDGHHITLPTHDPTLFEGGLAT